jgi:hypothetical protein
MEASGAANVTDCEAVVAALVLRPAVKKWLQEAAADLNEGIWFTCQGPPAKLGFPAGFLMVISTTWKNWMTLHQAIHKHYVSSYLFIYLFLYCCAGWYIVPFT